MKQQEDKNIILTLKHYMIMGANNNTFLGVRKNTILYIILCFTLYKLLNIGNKKDVCEMAKEYINQLFKESKDETTRQP